MSYYYCDIHKKYLVQYLSKDHKLICDKCIKNMNKQDYSNLAVLANKELNDIKEIEEKLENFAKNFSFDQDNEVKNIQIFERELNSILTSKEFLTKIVQEVTTRIHMMINDCSNLIKSLYGKKCKEKIDKLMHEIYDHKFKMKNSINAFQYLDVLGAVTVK